MGEQHSYAKQVLADKNIIIKAGDNIILDYKNNPNYSTKPVQTFMTVHPDNSELLPPKIKKIVSFKNLRGLGFTIVPVTLPYDGRWGNHRVKWKLARFIENRNLQIHSFKDKSGKHHVEYDTANKRLRLIGPKAGPHKKGEWFLLEPKKERVEEELDLDLIIDSPMDVINEVHRDLLDLPKEPKKIDVPEIPLIETASGDLVCLPNLPDEPTVIIVGQKRPLAGNTLVIVEDKIVSLKEIWDNQEEYIGKKVISYNQQRGKLEIDTIVGVIERRVRKRCSVKSVRLMPEKDVIKCSADHRFLLLNKGMVEAQKFRRGSDMIAKARHLPMFKKLLPDFMKTEGFNSRDIAFIIGALCAQPVKSEYENFLKYKLNPDDKFLAGKILSKKVLAKCLRSRKLIDFLGLVVKKYTTRKYPIIIISNFVLDKFKNFYNSRKDNYKRSFIRPFVPGWMMYADRKTKFAFLKGFFNNFIMSKSERVYRNFTKYTDGLKFLFDSREDCFVFMRLIADVLDVNLVSLGQKKYVGHSDSFYHVTINAAEFYKFIPLFNHINDKLFFKRLSYRAHLRKSFLTINQTQFRSKLAEHLKRNGLVDESKFKKILASMYKGHAKGERNKYFRYLANSFVDQIFKSVDGKAKVFYKLKSDYDLHSDLKWVPIYPIPKVKRVNHKIISCALPPLVEDCDEIMYCLNIKKNNSFVLASGIVTSNSGKSYFCHGVLDRAYHKKGWNKRIGILNDSLRETATWSLPNNVDRELLKKFGESPRPMPVVNLAPITKTEKPYQILNKDSVGFFMSLPADKILKNLSDYFKLDKSETYYEEIKKEILEAKSFEEIKSIVEESITNGPTRNKLVSILSTIFGKNLLDMPSGVSAYWQVGMGKVRKSFNPVTACLYAGIIPSLDLNPLMSLGEKYHPQYFRYLAQDIFNRQNYDSDFVNNNLQIWLFLDEVQDIASTQKKTVASDLLRQLVRQGGPKRIGTLVATQTYSTIPHDIRSNAKYLVSFVNPREADFIVKDFNLSENFRGVMKGLEKFECLVLTQEFFVVYSADGSRKKLRGPFVGKALPPLSLHKAPKKNEEGD